MCTFTQFWYECKHEASKPYRDGVCCRPCGPGCIMQTQNVVLSIPCERCRTRIRKHHPEKLDARMRQIARLAQRQNQAMAQAYWHIPSRCFIDPGMQRADPFAADRIKQRIEAHERARLARWSTSSFRGFRQKLHNLKTRSLGKLPSGSIKYHYPGALCCQGLRHWGTNPNKLVKCRLWDDRCVSHF